MYQQNTEQESDDLSDDTETVIPARLLRKLKCIPRLSELEKMFDEPSIIENNNNMTTTNLSREQREPISNNERPPETNSLNSVSHLHNRIELDQMPTSVVPPIRQSISTPSHTVTTNTVAQCINLPIDLTGDTEDDSESSSDNQEPSNQDSRPNTPTENSSTIMMEQILTRALISLKQINNGRLTNTPPQSGNPTRNPSVVIETSCETPAMSVCRLEPQEIQITHDNSHSNITIGNIGSITTQNTHKHCHGKKRYICLKRPDNTDTQMNKNQNDRYRVERVDRITCNVFKNRQQKEISKHDNSVYICNIAYLNKCGQSRKKSRVSAKAKTTSKTRSTSKMKPTSKDKKFGDCPVCMDKLNITNLRSAYCGHVFCVRCIRYIFLKGDKKCPTCRSLLENCGYHKLYL